ARLPEEYRRFVLTGADRLVELGEELHEVRTVLAPQHTMGVRAAINNLLCSMQRWLGKKVKLKSVSIDE
ncbi:MAG: hypothetical protein ACWGOX_14895, partial [Desulforhopalus sp.]